MLPYIYKNPEVNVDLKTCLIWSLYLRCWIDEWRLFSSVSPLGRILSPDVLRMVTRVTNETAIN